MAPNWLRVTVTTSTRLIAVHVTRTQNVVVGYAGLPGQTGTFTLTPSGPATSLVFDIARLIPRGSGMVYFNVEEQSGQTATFAGAGANGLG
jgi:pyruvate/2-oxoacid:ferredoxin oxidoreductase alpha subunit